MKELGTEPELIYNPISIPFQVCTEGRLILEFIYDDYMRIKSWHMAVRAHKELIPRNVIGMQQEPGFFEQLSKNITRQGITNSTLNYLRVSGDILRWRREIERRLFIVQPSTNYDILVCPFSYVLSWNQCKSSCRGTRRTS